MTKSPVSSLQITNEDALSELTAPTSGVILMLAAHLRQCVLPSEAPGSHIVSLDDTLGGRAPNLSSGPMMTILKGLVGVVLKCGGALQRVRANLYTALLYFIQAAQTSEGPHEKGKFHVGSRLPRVAISDLGLGPGKTRTHCGGNIVSYDAARAWQNTATSLRAARTQEMLLKVFRNTFCVRHNCCAPGKTRQHLREMLAPLVLPPQSILALLGPCTITIWV